MRAHKKLFNLFDIFFRRRRHFVGVVAVVVNVVPAPTFARIWNEKKYHVGAE